MWKSPRGRNAAAAGSAARRRPPSSQSVALTPEERALLQQTAADAGLPPDVVRRVVAGVERGAIPLDPYTVTARIRGLAELAGGDPAALLSTRAGPALLTASPGRLRRQAALLERLLPGYRLEWLLTGLPRWSVVSPELVVRRLQEVEELYQTHLGAPFPRERLGLPRQDWRWLMAMGPAAKTVNALELIVL